jgi:hypothetical protein
MTTINVTVHHSDEWVKEQRLLTGENLPDSVIIIVKPADLSLEVRKVLLNDWSCKYDDVRAIGYSRDWDIYPNYNNWGSERIFIDSHKITPQDVDAAILIAIGRIKDKKIRQELEEKKEKAEQEAKAKRRADAELELKDVLADLRSQITQLQSAKKK